MSLISQIRRHLGVKLFLSYLVVILVGVMVLASAVEFAVPTAFERHLSAMAAMMGGAARGMEMDLFTNFRAAVTEALILAVVVALAVALAVSLFVSRQIVTPVQQMMTASQRIAKGYYHERVYLPHNLRQDQMDELSRLALSFNQMATQLEQAEATRRELIGNVAHELRTPLSTIKGSMEGLIDGVLPAEPATFQQIYREADRLQRLVADLQELSRVESGAFDLQVKPVSVADLVATTLTRLSRQFEEKSVVLKTKISDSWPPVLADEDRIGQVLLNLVGNALQYTPRGGQVQISTQRQEGMMQITITDTGIGIASEHLPHLFTRFYRVDKSRSRAGGGSGIGLTIARHLVEAHGGRIWAESQGKGRGSTFGFSLPVANN